MFVELEIVDNAIFEFEIEDDSVFQLDFEAVQIIEVDSCSEYEGDYNVIPAIESQTLPTKEKKMVEDVVISPIPYYEVRNDKNGETIIIGGNL